MELWTSEHTPLSSPHHTIDGREVYLARSGRCALDSRGDFGPYLLLVVDRVEAMEFRQIRSTDSLHLERALRDGIDNGLPLESLIDHIENTYIRIDD